ncbi:MAG: hypothetical protein ABJF88_15430 [Rhodothermales bacterium]
MHVLERRDINDRYPHLDRRLFDPQLYLAGLSASASGGACTNLASYPWFGAQGLDDFDSALHKQSRWKKDAEKEIVKHWPAAPPSDPNEIEVAAQETVEFQVRLGCEAIILPSPLTRDPGSDYSFEIQWLESGLRQAKAYGDELPVLATIAIQDLCLLAAEPDSNPLLEIIADSVSARGVDGVYLVIEQGSEAADTRQCGNFRVLQSALHLTHILSNDAGIRVFINFLGAFGLACVAAGAESWASGWYKSLYRMKLSDKQAGGRAFPTYWSDGMATDIHLQSDLDTLASGSAFTSVATLTPPSAGLIKALSSGRAVASVPDWTWRQSNISAAQEHFIHAMARFDQRLQPLTVQDRINTIHEWLKQANALSSSVGPQLGSTKLSHISAWEAAFSAYRRDHNV